jgi:hypothetical protein
MFHSITSSGWTEQRRSEGTAVYNRVSSKPGAAKGCSVALAY